MEATFILSLVDKFNEGPLSELEFNDGVNHLILKKDPLHGKSLAGAPEHSCALAAQTVKQQSVDRAPLRNVTAYPHSGIEELELPEDSEKIKTITSPIVATFYESSSPDLPPFVKVGEKVKTGETLCILEAMKMMNKLTAEYDLEVLSIEVKNGDLVEFEQVLFRVKEL